MIIKNRPRRLRINNNIRTLIAEHSINVTDLIYPVFIIDGVKIRENIISMPNIVRFSIDELLIEIEVLLILGIRAIALFPVINNGKKTINGEEAFNKNGLVQRAVRIIKQQYKDLIIITDVALDPFTTHGQDGIVDDNNYVLNDKTIKVLQQQALSHAIAGADIVAPSDMMDGRIGAIRQTLEENNFTNTIILSYAAKYASNYYSPFRDAINSKIKLKNANKNSYQMDFANSNEAIKEISLDIKEGADIIMIKPGIAYLDIIYKAKQKFNTPIFAYQVSGEYAMIKLSAKHNIIDEKKIVLETLTAFKRAGADNILTYYAKEIAQWLANK